MIHTASIRERVSINQKYRYRNSLVSLFWNVVRHAQVCHELRTTGRVSPGADASGGDGSHCQRTHRAWCSVPWPMYGPSSHWQSVTNRAVASHVYWLWRWRHVCRKNDAISALDIYKADFEQGLGQSREYTGENCSKIILSILYRCTNWTWNDCLKMSQALSSRAIFPLHVTQFIFHYYCNIDLHE